MEYKHKIFNFIFLLTVLATASCQDKNPEFAHTNALIHETSPYLLQHAHNPVDWVAWSPEALETARKENKLVIISIGYSSCHWCHVMESETFEDTAAARIMNKDFISIKVDREERPDVDHIYMTAGQLMTGRGGWPLNIVALPNGKPIYAGTYHSNADWKKMLTQMNKVYRDDPKKVEAYADQVADGIQESNIIPNPTGETEFTKIKMAEAVAKDSEYWDQKMGGYQGAQKFPLPSNIQFLLDYALLNEDVKTKIFVKNTLDHIVKGGIYDHIGGGFFRYSTDSKWKVPHFEKMLYDNAQLISVYSKAYQVFKEPAYKNAVYESIAFLERKMKNPAGGYYSAVDADSEGVEGKYYIWKKDELETLLGSDFELFSNYYNIRAGEAFEDNAFVLYKTKSDSAFAKANKLSIGLLEQQKQSWKQELAKARKKRIFPRIDDKIITSWNALLIEGFVDAYEAFGDEDFLNLAVANYDFLQKHSVKGKRLLHSYKEGANEIPGFLDDYAFMAAAALDLYGATTETRFLDFAKSTTEEVMAHYADSSSVLFRYDREDRLISKIIKIDDGVIPSGNAVMAHTLFNLGHILGDDTFLERSRTMLHAVGSALSENSSSYSIWGKLYLQFSNNYYEIAVVGEQSKTLLKALNQQKYLPNVLITGSEVASSLPLFESRYVPGETLIYVCENRACKRPVNTVAEAMGQLEDFKERLD